MMLDKVLDKIKETIGIIKFDVTKILIDTDEKLPEYITLSNVVMLMTQELLKMTVNFIHKYFWKNHCLLNKYVVQKDCGIRPWLKMRIKEVEPIFT